jgi:hypothetical protein
MTETDIITRFLAAVRETCQMDESDAEKIESRLRLEFGGQEIYVPKRGRRPTIETADVRAVARAARVSQRTVYRWRKRKAENDNR